MSAHKILKLAQWAVDSSHEQVTGGFQQPSRWFKKQWVAQVLREIPSKKLDSLLAELVSEGKLRYDGRSYCLASEGLPHRKITLMATAGDRNVFVDAHVPFYSPAQVQYSHQGELLAGGVSYRQRRSGETLQHWPSEVSFGASAGEKEARAMLEEQSRRIVLVGNKVWFRTF